MGQNMFGIVKRLRARARQRARALFGFWDGFRTKHVDPYQVHRRLHTHPDLPSFADYANLFDQGVEPEATQFITAIADTFGIQRWDDAKQTGLTDIEIVGILNDFYNWMDGVKKNGPDSQTSSDATDSESSEAPSVPDSTMKPASDSGSTSNESNSEPPTPQA